MERELFLPRLLSIALAGLGLLLWSELLNGQGQPAVNDQRRVVKAYCDALGAHVVYSAGPQLTRKNKRGEQCTNLRVSEDRRSVGWQIDSEVQVTDDTGLVMQRFRGSRLFINGVEIREATTEGVLYEWRFRPGYRQVIFEVGPLHGGGNLFLYDIEQKRVFDQCLTRDPDVTTCGEWADLRR